MKPKSQSDSEKMWGLLVESKSQPVEETTHRDDKKDALGPGEYVCPKTGNIMNKEGEVVHKKEDKKVEEASKPDYIDADNDGDKEESMKKALKDKESGKTHECAKKVQHEMYGLGECVHAAHGKPINGHVNWYTVVFEHGTEVVDTEDLIILASEKHSHS